MVSKLNPRYHLHSTRYFSDYEIPHMYSHVKGNVVVPKLKETTFFSATTEMWTSAVNDSYMTITILFISSDWELNSLCMETVSLFADHTGQNIADAILDILENRNFSRDNLVSTTTDSGSNIVSVFRILNALRVNCFRCNLDLTIRKGLDNTRVQTAIARCHSSVELFHRSYKKTRDL